MGFSSTKMKIRLVEKLPRLFIFNDLFTDWNYLALFSHSICFKKEFRGGSFSWNIPNSWTQIRGDHCITHSWVSVREELFMSKLFAIFTHNFLLLWLPRQKTSRIFRLNHIDCNRNDINLINLTWFIYFSERELSFIFRSLYNELICEMREIFQLMIEI